MTFSKPIVLLLHGCFSNPAIYDRLAPYFEQKGYPTARATFPSSNPRNPLEVTAQQDINHVRDEYLLPLVERDRQNVLLVVHSYGGVVGGSAATGLSRASRSTQGLEGGVIGLVYIAGNIVQEGQSLIASVGGQWPPWLIKDNPSRGLATIDPLMDTLCHDCDTSLESEVRKGMVPHGYHCLETEASLPCWAEKSYSGRLAYVRTVQDKINPVFAQDLWMESTKVQWHVVSMDTSHSPLLSQPKELAENILEFSRKFEAL